jgi:hypothetical protein
MAKYPPSDTFKYFTLIATVIGGDVSGDHNVATIFVRTISELDFQLIT